MSKQIQFPPSDRILVCDGAMGTMIHSKGVPLGQSFDEINVSQPEIVAEIHRAYIEAGAEIIETNTFGANRLKMDVHGLGHRLRDMNLAGVSIARDCAGGDALVAGSVGPTGKLMQPFGPLDFETVVEVYAEQIASLCEGGVDILIIETMQDLREAKAALLAAQRCTEIPVVVQMSFAQEGRSMMGTPPDVAAVVLSACGADLVGTNCGTGPQDMLSALQAMSRVTSVGLTAQPNAGLPKFFEGRLMYISTPAYVAEFARQFAASGAVVVGGCCGTTPDHVKSMASAVKSAKPIVRERDSLARLASRTRLVEIGGGAVVIMGSALADMRAGSRSSSEQLVQYVQSEVERQWRQSAAIVALDCDSPDFSASRLVELAQTSSQASLCLIGSANTALEAGLAAVEGRCLLMMPGNVERGIQPLMALARRYGAGLVIRSEVAEGCTAEQRVNAAREALECAERMGFHRADVIVHAGELTTREGELLPQTVETVRAVKSGLHMNVAAGYAPGSAHSADAVGLLERVRAAGLDVLIADSGSPEVQSMVGANSERPHDSVS